MTDAEQMSGIVKKKFLIITATGTGTLQCQEDNGSAHEVPAPNHQVFKAHALNLKLNRPSTYCMYSIGEKKFKC